MSNNKFATDYLLKTDCTAARQRHRDFWQHLTLDSPLLVIKAQKKYDAPPLLEDRQHSRQTQELELTWQTNQCRRQILAYDFLFDSMPTAGVILGRSLTNMGVLAGHDYAVHDDSEYVSFARHADFLFAPTAEFDENSLFVQKVLAVYRGVKADMGAAACLNPPTAADAISTMAMIMGTENLLRSCCQHPDAVRQKCRELNKLFYNFYDYIYQHLLAWGGGESASWLPVFAEGRFDCVRSDISLMLSEEMFAELALPALADACAYLDDAMFNFNAVEMIRFLPALADIKKLQGIYWNIEPWHSDFPRYIPVLRQIREWGLLLALPCRDCLDAKRAINKLGKSGLLLELPVFAEKDQGLAAGEELINFAKQCLY